MPLVCLVLANLSVMTTSSRMIFAFARYVAHENLDTQWFLAQG